MAAELFTPPSKALDANANPYAGAKWYFYQSGTTTPTPVYTTAALSVAHTNPVVADSSGKFANIYINPSIATRGILKNADDSVTLHDIDPISNGALAALGLADGATLVNFQQAGTGAVTRTAQDKLRETVSVKDFGATGDGVTNDRAACQAAIDAVKAAGGGTVMFPEGTYLLTGTAGADGTLHGLLNKYEGANGDTNRVFLQGYGKSTILKANSNSMYIIRHSDSHSGVSSMTLDGNGKTGIVGLAVVPEDLTQTTQVTYQLYNKFTGIFYKNCDEAIMLRTGPDVAGVDSGCWYNEFSSSQIYLCLRGIWLRDCPAGSSGNNRNQFINIRIGQGVNTGVQIDDGDTNTFIAVNVEGIQTGTSPNATPTGFKIDQTGASGLDNNSNRFIGCTGESCTRYVDNANSSTELWACTIGDDNLFTAVPSVITGGDASIQPYRLPRMFYQAGPHVAAYAEGIQYFEAENGAAVENAGYWGFKSDLTTGLGRAASATGALYAAGIEKARWTTTTFGIGTNTPDSTLQVANANGAGLRIGISGTTENYFDGNTQNFRTAAGSQIYTLTSTGINLASGKVLQVNAVTVVGARKTGWATATGTATRTTFDTTTVTLPQLAERVKALIDDLHGTAGHGLIGT